MASASTSALRTAASVSTKISGSTPRSAIAGPSNLSHRPQFRTYAPAPAYAPQVDTSDLLAPDDLGSQGPSSHASSSRSPQTPFRRPAPTATMNHTTPLQAQAYLSDLLHLSPSRAFPPSLALQILTHRSYRYAHNVRRSTETDSEYAEQLPSDEARAAAQLIAPHNARLIFLGRRAYASYLALFVHSAISSTKELHDLDFLRGETLQTKLYNMQTADNYGKNVGTPWGVGRVMRWDGNLTAKDKDASRIKAHTVDAILGGVFARFGSPAANRAFHYLVMPHMERQLRDPRLIERAHTVRSELKKEEGELIVSDP